MKELSPVCSSTSNSRNGRAPIRCSLCHIDGTDSNGKNLRTTSSNHESYNVHVLPEGTHGILDCAKQEIRRLQGELSTSFSSSCGDTADVEDALDDGFMMIDLNVLTTKLEKWYELFGSLEKDVSVVDNGSNEAKNSDDIQCAHHTDTDITTDTNDTTDAAGRSRSTGKATTSSNEANSNSAFGVIPYFAMKCNPNRMVVHWLANQQAHHLQSTNTTTTFTTSHLPLEVGFDCASLPEIELAVQELDSPIHRNIYIIDDTQRKVQRIVYANPQRAEYDLKASLNLPIPSRIKSKSKLNINTEKEQDGSGGLDSLDFPTVVWFTLDGIEELYKIHRAVSSSMYSNDNMFSRIQLIFRILVPDGHSSIPLGEKFGSTLNDLSKMVPIAISLGFSIIGVSFHCGSGCHDPETYQIALNLAREALNVIDNEVWKAEEEITNSKNPNNHTEKENNNNNNKSKKKKCWLLDIGGGFPGVDGVGGDFGRFSNLKEFDTTNAQHAIGSSNETTLAIANAIRPMLQSLQEERSDLVLIAEPGRYFVEASACLVSRIYKVSLENQSGQVLEEENVDKEEVATRVYQIAHGVHGVFKDVLLCNEAFIPMPLSHEEVMNTANVDNNSHKDSSRLYKSKVQGPSGESEDIVCNDCLLPNLNVGDWLVFDRMGAYTLSIASRSGQPVIRYVVGGGRYFSE